MAAWTSVNRKLVGTIPRRIRWRCYASRRRIACRIICFLHLVTDWGGQRIRDNDRGVRISCGKNLGTTRDRYVVCGGHCGINRAKCRSTIHIMVMGRKSGSYWKQYPRHPIAHRTCSSHRPNLVSIGPALVRSTITARFVRSRLHFSLYEWNSTERRRRFGCVLRHLHVRIIDIGVSRRHDFFVKRLPLSRSKSLAYHARSKNRNLSSL